MFCNDIFSDFMYKNVVVFLYKFIKLARFKPENMIRFFQKEKINYMEISSLDKTLPKNKNVDK